MKVGAIYKKIAVGMASVLGAFVIFGQGCGQFKTDSGGLALKSQCEVDDVEIIDTTIEVIPDSKTLAISYGSNVLSSMVSCTLYSDTDVSQQTLQEFEDRKNSLSEYGKVSDVNGPMMMAFAALAGEVCNDLINKESRLPASARLFFGDYDFASQNPQSLSTGLIESSADKLAASCWGELAASDQEKQILVDGTQEILNTSGNVIQPHRLAALSLCTTMLASTKAFVVE